jgi:Ca-activated chloride channel family protein
VSLRTIAIGFTILLTTAFAHADGLIVVENGPAIPNHFAFAPMEVTFHHVTTDIDDQVAVTSVDEEFYNRSNQRLEGTYIFPLPTGAHIDKFAMDIDGKEVEAELLSSDKARSIYEDIVRKSRDPALLEYAGRDAVKVRIFPIEPNGRKHVKLKYTQLLTADSGLSEYVYPLNTEKFSSAPLGDVSVTINLHASEPIKSLYSPSHNVTIHRDGDRTATIEYAERGVRPDTDFKLVYSQATDAIAINLLTCKSPGSDDGYFLLLASPGVSADKAAVQPKDICFVLDTSGSMAGPKIEQAKRSLRFCLNNLNDGDHFEVIRFSTETEPLFGSLKPAAKDNVDAALKFVDALHASGGTAIDDALQHAIAIASHSSDRPYLIVFLTDGQPTIGETSEDKIVADTTSSTQVHIFCFGIGNDVNTHLLDRIAEGTKAASDYVGDNEDIEVKVSNLYAKIREPAMTDVSVANARFVQG